MRPDDPYRVLFQQLPTAIAHCRLIVSGGQVIDVDLLETNAAFDAVRGAVPQLLGALSQQRGTNQSTMMQLRSEHAVLSVAIYPSGDDHAMVVIEDVTARDRLEQRSRESQDRFEQAFRGNAAAMVIAHQDDLRIIDVNPRWLEMFGMDRVDVIGHTAMELGLITKTNAQVRIAQHREFAGGYDIELELLTRTGTPLTVLASAKPIQIAEGSCTLTTLIDITSRKYAEEAFAAVFNASPAGMLLVEQGSDSVIAVNRRLLDMTGYRRDDIIGHRAGDLAMTAGPSRGALLVELERSGRLSGFEYELACRDGSTIWALASTEMITLHGAAHRLSVFTDITGRKRLERRLGIKHLVGRHLAEAADLGSAIPHVLEAMCRGEGWACGAAWLVDVEAGALNCCGTWRASDVATDLAAMPPALGSPRGDLLARVVATAAAEKIVIAPPAITHGLVAAIDMHYVVSFPIRHGDNILGVVAMAARQRDEQLDTAERELFDSAGQLLGLFIQRTRAESELRALNVELVRSHDRLRTLASVSHALVLAETSYQALLDQIARTTADLVGDGCLVTLLSEDGERMVNVANAHRDPALAEQYRAFVGRMTASAITSSAVSSTVARTGVAHRADTTPSAMVAASEAALRPTVEILNVHSYAVVPIRARQTVLGTLSLLRSAPGRSYTDDDLTLMQDLSDRAGLAIENARLYDELEQRVRVRTAELHHANEELEAFSYSVAHDLRSPLRAISGYSEIIAEDYAASLDADGVTYLAKVRSAAKRMGHLIDDLLNLSRVGRADLRRQRVEVSTLAHAVIDRLRATDPNRSVEVVVEGGLVALADPSLLEIALTNLLGNAWKFTGKQARARIALASFVREHSTTYVVRDNGAGFEPAHAKKLFGVFQRLHTDNEFEGTGIGLAIVQRIIQRHGGRIWAEGSVNQGATFFFTLDEAEPPAPAT